ncbi:PAS domain S-box-containing protein [Marinomonas alcarazii]|uniref:Sensory/regulatory protein RpfC n=1 Tax=Marinomonas alcarazii TaxID=491949 RepID=A0A318V7R4_9GAMM|nr:response regulator [Marinomonas alcarazii]PYF84644.1 PAS domain S-box-containing protein [Marinomonas alcarazii]
MDPLQASLKVARSLLGMSCSGLLFEDGRVVISGDGHGVDFTDTSFHSQELNSSRQLHIQQRAATSPFLSRYFQVSSYLSEFIPLYRARLFFLDVVPCSTDISEVNAHIDDLVDVISGLLASDLSQSSSESPEFMKDEALLSLSNNVPVYLALLDCELRYQFVNEAYAQRFNSSRDACLGKYVKDLVPAEVYTKIEPKLREALQGSTVEFHYEVDYSKCGGEVRFNKSSYIPRIEQGQVVGIYVCVQDVTRQRRTLKTLHHLHEVATNAELSLDDKLQEILEIGTEQFALPIGLISSITGDVYEVKYCQTPNGEVLQGERFDLADTYCVHALGSNVPTSYFHTAISDIKEHPCYVIFGLEAYIGMVVRVGGKCWGVLSFSSPDPKKYPFSEDDNEVMKLLAQWIGNEMTLEQDRAIQAQYERELREQKIFFETLFVNAPEAIVMVGADRTIKMINPAFTELFGYELNEVKGESTRMLYAEERDFLNQGKAYSKDVEDVLNRYRVSYKHKRGKIFHAETIGNMIKNLDGSLGGYIAHVRDVTERLEVERQMINTNLRLSVAADAAGIGVWEFDLQSNKLHWDEWMYRLYGTSKSADVTPLDVWDECVIPEDKVRLSEVFSNLDRNGHFTAQESDYISKTLDFDFKIIRKDGQTRYLKSNAILVLDKQGHASHLVGVNMDITSRKETEVLLRDASKQAVAASKAKSDFLATMSHEIRTPLNGVLGMAELLSGTALNPEQTEQLKVLRESGEGLLTLINDLLDFSKIEAGHLSIERVDFNLEKSIYDVVRMLVVKAEEKGIDLLVEFDESCPRFLVGDVFRIKQILINLISNAIKFTSVGHVLVTVKGTVDKKGIAALTMSVSDTGVGIDKNVQPLLFNAFVQADSSTTRKFGGTGLGLAITKQLIDLMNGSIALVSEPDVGSTFTVTVSLPESHAISHIEAIINEDLLIGKKTLIVDDNETNLTILKNQLRSCDIYADAESKTEKALHRVIQALDDGVPYQIVVTDYMMPDIDGLMLTRRIREVTGSNHQPIILMTTSAGLLTSEVLSDAGVNINVAKPMTGVMLKKSLIAALSTHFIGRQYSYLDAKEHSAEDESTVIDQVEHQKRGLILVVEDMKANMAVAKGILERIGFDVVGAENGAVGIEMWEAHYPDLIFMDLHMPVMDGLTSMRHIRQAEKSAGRTRVPILALTADIMPETLSEVFRSGGNGLLPKPFKQKEFISMLDKWLPANQSQHADEEPPVLSAGSAFTVQSDVIINEVALGELKMILGDDFVLLVEAFYADADSILGSFEEILKQDGDIDCEHISRLAHSLKSISQNVGAMTMSSMAAQLEKEGREGEIPELHTKLQELLAMYHEVKNKLQDILSCQ